VQTCPWWRVGLTNGNCSSSSRALQHAGYLDPVNCDGEWNPSDFAIQLTRRRAGLPFCSPSRARTAATAPPSEQTLTVAAPAALIRKAITSLLVEPTSRADLRADRWTRMTTLLSARC